MADVEVGYKGSTIGSLNASGTLTLDTAGTWVEDDIEIDYTVPPNTYTAGDEGKVVSSGALVSQGSATYTSNNTYDTTLINSVTVNVSGGGGGIGTLIKTQSLGAITASGTNEADTGISLSVPNVNDYDILIVEASVDTVVNNRHMASVRIVLLSGTASVSTKDGAQLTNRVWNAKRSSDGVVTTRNYTTAYGIYPKDPSISDGTVTMEMYKRYNSTYTNSINGTYTVRVYGVKLYDLIGG